MAILMTRLSAHPLSEPEMKREEEGEGQSNYRDLRPNIVTGRPLHNGCIQLEFAENPSAAHIICRLVVEQHVGQYVAFRQWSSNPYLPRQADADGRTCTCSE